MQSTYTRRNSRYRRYRVDWSRFGTAIGKLFLISVTGVALSYHASLGRTQPPVAYRGAALRQSSSVVVGSGDSLWSIATRLSRRGSDPRSVVRAIQKENRLDGTALTPGMSLKVPPYLGVTPDEVLAQSPQGGQANQS